MKFCIIVIMGSHVRYVVKKCDLIFTSYHKAKHVPILFGGSNFCITKQLCRNLACSAYS